MLAHPHLVVLEQKTQIPTGFQPRSLRSHPGLGPPVTSLRSHLTDVPVLMPQSPTPPAARVTSPNTGRRALYSCFERSLHSVSSSSFIVSSLCWFTSDNQRHLLPALLLFRELCLFGMWSSPSLPCPSCLTAHELISSLQVVVLKKQFKDEESMSTGNKGPSGSGGRRHKERDP